MISEISGAKLYLKNLGSSKIRLSDLPDYPTFTSICFGFISSAFGTVISRTPFL